MLTHRLLDALPVSGVLLVTLLLLLAAYEAGYHWGRWDLRRSGKAMNSYLSTVLSTVVSAMLLLLAFMLGFAFVMASARFDERKALVLQEANAIGTTWLRARTLPPPYPEKIIPLLREYLDVRLSIGAGQKANLSSVHQAIARSGELHERLWAQTIQLAHAHPTSRVVSLFMVSLNQMIDLHQSRVSVALDFRIVPSVWRTLYLVAMLTLITTGYQAGRGGARHPLLVALSLGLMLAAIFALIIDLDRPVQQLFRIEPKPLMDVHNTMAVSKGPKISEP
jgi:hypothetical protein